MSYQGQNPDQQGQFGRYGAYTPPRQPTEPYSGQGSYQQGGHYNQQYGQSSQSQPNTGYEQPQYGQPGQPGGYQQPYNYYDQFNATPSSGRTSMGLAQNVAVGLSYALWWVTGLIFLFVEKQNRMVRFHAMQSIIFFGGLQILGVILAILGLGLLGYFVFLVEVVGWIVLMINGFQGKDFKIPCISQLADTWVGQIKVN